MMNRTEAEKYLVAGVNSPVRAYKHVQDAPVFIERAEGAEVIDTEGNRLIDFIMGWGPLILGHAHPAVVKAAQQSLANGALFGLTHPAEVHLAKKIVEAVPSVERVRFTVSGTEACMTAVRLARHVTGCSKVLMIHGGYHGHSDALLVGQTQGIPDSIATETLHVPFGDMAALQKVFTEHGKELACFILEPVAANMGVMEPDLAYLKQARQLTQDTQTLLIFDEVVTGFRLHYGCAQTLFDVTPDLTTFGKIIGGGLPIGAVGGSQKLMSHLAPEGQVYHGGTFAGSPVSMAGGLAALNALQQEGVYAKINALAESLQKGLLSVAQQCDVPLKIHRQGSMLTVFFSDGPIQGVDSVSNSQRDVFAAWIRGLRKAGVLAPPSPYEGWFISTAHTQEHMDRVIEISESLWSADVNVKIK